VTSDKLIQVTIQLAMSDLINDERQAMSTNDEQRTMSNGQRIFVADYSSLIAVAHLSLLDTHRSLHIAALPAACCSASCSSLVTCHS
jgi:hypothetical protein